MSNKKGEEFSESDIENLISVYKRNEVLWKASHPDYKKKSMKTELLERIRDSEFHGKYTVQDIKNKIHNLRTQYFREKKHPPTGSSGKKRKLWKYFEDLSFLSDGIEISESDSNMDFGDEVSVAVPDEQFEDNLEVGCSEVNTSVLNDHSKNHTSALVKKKKRDKSDELLDAAINSLKSVQDEKVDKWELFGKLVAQELKELEPAVADRAKLHIQVILFKAKYP